MCIDSHDYEEPPLPPPPSNMVPAGYHMTYAPKSVEQQEPLEHQTGPGPAPENYRTMYTGKGMKHHYEHFGDTSCAKPGYVT